MVFKKKLNYTKDDYNLAPIEMEINFVKVLNFDKVIGMKAGKGFLKMRLRIAQK